MNIMLQELVPSPHCSRSSPLQAYQSAVVFPGQAVLLLPLRLICHRPDLKLLDLCLKTFKTLRREVIHWIRKPVGQNILVLEQKKVLNCISVAAVPQALLTLSVWTWPVMWSCSLFSRENTFEYQGWVHLTSEIWYWFCGFTKSSHSCFFIKT